MLIYSEPACRISQQEPKNPVFGFTLQYKSARCDPGILVMSRPTERMSLVGWGAETRL